MDKKLSDYLEKVASAIASDGDCKKLVESIENGIKTTKGNYAKWVQVLKPYANDKAFMLGMAQGLIRLGGDSYGIHWAMKLINDKVM